MVNQEIQDQNTEHTSVLLAVKIGTKVCFFWLKKKTSTHETRESIVIQLSKPEV